MRKFWVKDAECQSRVVGKIGTFLDSRDDLQWSLAGGYCRDRLAYELPYPRFGDRTLALHDHLVERRLGGEPVPPALESHVPGGSLERVANILDQPTRDFRAPDAGKHLSSRRTQDLVGAERVEERGRREPGRDVQFLRLAAASSVLRRGARVGADDVRIQRRLVALPSEPQYLCADAGIGQVDVAGMDQRVADVVLSEALDGVGERA